MVDLNALVCQITCHRNRPYAARGGQREARRKLAEMVTEAERGLTARTAATVGEVLETWFEFAAPEFSPEDGRGDAGYIDRSLMPTVGSNSLARLKPAELDEFSWRLLASPGVGWVGRSSARARDRATNPRHPATCAQPGREAGVDRHQRSAATTPGVPVSDITPPASEDLARVASRR